MSYIWKAKYNRVSLEKFVQECANSFFVTHVLCEIPYSLIEFRLFFFSQLVGMYSIYLFKKVEVLTECKVNGFETDRTRNDCPCIW